MSTLSQFTTQRVTKSVIHGTSSTGTGPQSGLYTASAREVLSGALTASTLKTLLTISGAGEISHLMAYTKEATARTLRIKVTLDGIVVFDATTPSFSANTTGAVVVGDIYEAPSIVITRRAPLRFSTSCVVEVASSLSETDKLAIGYTAQTF